MILKNTSKIETVMQQIFLRQVKDEISSNMYIVLQFGEYCDIYGVVQHYTPLAYKAQLHGNK